MARRWLKLIAVVVVALLSARPVQAAEWHVSPQGTAPGDGSQAKPWDLQTALNQPPAVKPGDIIWLHGGTYKGNLNSRLNGTAKQPIIVRQAPGEHAVIDAYGRGASLNVIGDYTWFWGFEVMSSVPDRASAEGGSHPPEMQRGGDLVTGNDPEVGIGTRFINLVVHDLRQGFGFWQYAENGEINGCIIFHNGWAGPDRGHGHGIYTQNRTGTKRLIDNIVFGQYGDGFSVYTENGYIDNFHIEGNVTFNNGVAEAGRAGTRGILVGGKRPADHAVVIGNMTYSSPGAGGVGLDLGWSRKGVTSNAVIKDNYLTAAGKDALRARIYTGEFEKVVYPGKETDATITGNFVYGTLQAEGGWDAKTQTKPNLTAKFTAMFPHNTWLGAQRPKGTKIIIRPNQYEPGRANIIVYNWDNQDEVAVEVSTVLKPGDKYEVRDAQSFFGAPVVAGVYDGKAITLPMTLTAVTPVVGVAPDRQPPHTPKEFNVFVLQRVAAIREK